MATLLRASEHEHDERDTVDVSRSSLVGRTYALRFEETDIYVDGERLESRLFISQPLLWEPSPLDKDLNDVDFFGGEEPCRGADCEEECLIPDEYKVVSEEQVQAAMAFLDIRKAEPLLASRPIMDWQ